MRIQGHNNKLETNVQNETQEFGIGDASVVIEILRNRLYENKVQTLVQEYICNARDAMRELNKGNEFEVTVPTRLHPVFKVRDFGPGITPDRMKGVFVMYGASTKRNTNNQTGGFGIGAKSAWSYTDSFTIVSVTDGVRRTYVAHTGVNNNGRLDLVSSDDTTDPTGTEIQVAVKPHDIEEFRNAIFRAIYFWDKKPKLRGELNPPVLVSGFRLGDNLEVIDENKVPDFARMEYNSIMAVIDGIPYTITQKLLAKVKSLNDLKEITKKRIILHFGNGIVEVSASRESIADSPHTLASLEKIGNKAYIAARDHIKMTFAKVKSTSEYLHTYAEKSEFFDVDYYANFAGYSIKHSLIGGGALDKINLTSVSCLNRRGTRCDKVKKDEWGSGGNKHIEVKRINSVFYNTIEENKVVQNKRFREYLFKVQPTLILIEPKLVIEYKDGKDKDGKDIKIESNRYLDMASFDQVVADLGAKCLQTLTYVDPPKQPRVKVQRENAAICVHTLQRGRHKYTTLATNTQKYLFVPIVKDKGWVTGVQASTSEIKQLDEHLREHHDVAVCGLADRGLKMVSGNKDFSPLADWLKAYKPTKDEINYAMRETGENHETVRSLGKFKGIDDPFVSAMIKEYKSFTVGKVRFVPEILIKVIRELPEVKDFKAMDEKLAKLMKSDYPLVLEVAGYSSQNEELAFYMNAKYKKGKK